MGGRGSARKTLIISNQLVGFDTLSVFAKDYVKKNVDSELKFGSYDSNGNYVPALNNLGKKTNNNSNNLAEVRKEFSRVDIGFTIDSSVGAEFHSGIVKSGNQILEYKEKFEKQGVSFPITSVTFINFKDERFTGRCVSVNVKLPSGNHLFSETKLIINVAHIAKPGSEYQLDDEQFWKLRSLTPSQFKSATSHTLENIVNHEIGHVWENALILNKQQQKVIDFYKATSGLTGVSRYGSNRGGSSTSNSDFVREFYGSSLVTAPRMEAVAEASSLIAKGKTYNKYYVDKSGKLVGDGGREYVAKAREYLSYIENSTNRITLAPRTPKSSEAPKAAQVVSPKQKKKKKKASVVSLGKIDVPKNSKPIVQGRVDIFKAIILSKKNSGVFKAKDILAPITVSLTSDGRYVVTDGLIRLEAYKQLGIYDIPIKIVK